MNERIGRNVSERVVISGLLVLETPAHFGNGDPATLTDMTLARDPLDRSLALLTGASVAGALRAYLREYAGGYGADGDDLSEQLFGKIEGNFSHQSWLMVDDALSCPVDSQLATPGGYAPVSVELRDGVSIHAATRTAEDGKKYDVELLQAGTTFRLGFELLLTKNNANLLAALAIALRGLQAGEIGLGQRKRRGFGQCRVTQWHVRRYNLGTPQGLIGWLDDDLAVGKPGKDIMALLDLKGKTLPTEDRRATFTIDATFAVPGSLLIRSGAGAPGEPDMVHLRSRRGEAEAPILSGTSLAGAIRGRALRIANTIWPQDADQASYLIDETFGRRIEKHTDAPSGSRLIVRESELEGTRALVQNRVKLDRFTGGSYPQALFSQEPAIGGADANVNIVLTLRQRVTDPEPLRKAQIGLLLLILKDLWTGDLPVGGESSVGRGRLAGRNAKLILQQGKDETTWQLEQTKTGLNATPIELEDYVKALWAYQMPKKQRKEAK
jgi:CRISPR/Cas system CSM-associated protein Csm3 (group 7 of RAMP superfamily)